MTVSARTRGKSSRIPSRSRLTTDALVGAALFATAIAIIPIVFALFSGGPGSNGTTAFAAAPAGNYAIVAKMNRTDDAIFAVPAGGGTPMQVADIPHLDGFGSNGAVSPDGRQLVLVAVDAGSHADPGASLLLVNLESGAVTRLATAIDPQQTPVWSGDGRSVVVSRVSHASDPLVDVSFSTVATDLSGEQALGAAKSVLGAYAVGFDPSGAFYSVIIEGRGSTLVRNGSELTLLSSQITRDWRLSPDGTQLAFVVSDLTGGLHYTGQVTSLSGDSPRGSAQRDASQSLGAAWAPGAGGPVFGKEPAAGDARAMAAGFDVPLAYAQDGSALAVQHWTGSGFSDHGKVDIQLVEDGRRTPLDDFARFYGWAAR